MSEMNNRSAVVRNGLILGLFAFVAVALLSGLKYLTADRIEAQARTAQARVLSELLAADSYDNDLLASRFPIKHRLLGLSEPRSAYIARKGDQATAILLPVIAPDGYSGNIELLVAIQADGRIAAVRTLNHRETPGLGDKIELSKSPWVLSFLGASLDNPTKSGWAVKKDQGEFDQFAGATITPRAVVKAVHQALEFFKLQGDRLLNPVQPAQDASSAGESTHELP